MGLQRTPPQRARPIPSTSTNSQHGAQTQPQRQLSQQPEPQPLPSEEINHAVEGDKTASSEVDKTTLSNMTPGRAFAPRRPGVMRTPPSGENEDRPLSTVITGEGRVHEHIDERPIRPAPTVHEDMHVDSQERDVQGGVDAEVGSVQDASGAGTEMELDDRTGGDNHWGNIVGMESESRQAQGVAGAAVGAQEDIEAEAAVEAEMLTEEPSIREDERPTAAPTAVDMDIDPTPINTAPQRGLAQSTHPQPAPRKSTTTSQLQPQRSSFQSSDVNRLSTPEPVAGPSVAPTTPAAQTSAPKTPRSRSRRPTEPLPSPPRPLPLDDEEDEFGRRYQLTMETLERAVKAGAQRWTPEHLKGCFPQLSKDNSKAMQNMCMSASQSMAFNILQNAQAHMEHYKVGAALKSIDAVDQEAREYARNNPSAYGSGKCERPDAWRADLEPQALVAATILPIYDGAYAKLREEYLDLHGYCANKYKAIREKQALLRELEDGVAEGVADLQKLSWSGYGKGE
ncbi:hypothetical protein I317_07585 [Kwoniella heveanensis CBS 569]|nr:hypothetical protein I317_07585 [Kwoniella heveanensis CBS 569]